MIVRLAGLAFEAGPEERLGDDERASLGDVGRSRTARGATERELGNGAWRLEVVNAPPWRSDDQSLFPAATAARVTCEGEAVRVSHSGCIAEILPAEGRARLFRDAGAVTAIEMVLRVALACRLPLEESLPLHAAAVEVEGSCIAFLGPSGAGKSTVASVSPYPVLSDERVVAARTGNSGAPWELTTTGFWGPFGTPLAPTGFFPLRALVRLRKGPRLVVERLGPQESFVTLLDAITVPASPPLWARAMPLAARLLAEVPVYEMTWHSASPPWEALLEQLRRDTTAPAP